MPDEWGNAFLHSDLVAFLDANPDATEVTLRINSPGGSVRTGNAIIETLQNSGKAIHTVGEELVGSMATQIFLIGQTRSLYPSTEFFLHNVQGGVMGDPSTIEQYLNEMKAYNEAAISFYMKRAGIDRETLTVLLDNEVTLTGREAKELGFATALIEPVAAYIQKPKTMKLTEKIKALFSEGQPVTNDLELALANGQKLQVSTGNEIPTLGDGVKVDGQSTDDGEYVLADNRIFVISGGKIDDILNPVIEQPEAIAEEEDMPEAEAQTPDAISVLEARIAELEKALTTQATAMKAENDELATAVTTLAEQMKKATSGGVKVPAMNAFQGEPTDTRPLSERVAEVMGKINGRHKK